MPFSQSTSRRLWLSFTTLLCWSLATSSHAQNQPLHNSVQYITVNEQQPLQLEFSHSDGEFTEILLHTRGAQFLIATQSAATGATVYSNNESLLLQNRLLLTSGDCRSCQLTITSELPNGRTDKFLLEIKTYSSQTNQARLSWLQTLQSLLVGTDFLPDPPRLQALVATLSNSEAAGDQLMACQLQIDGASDESLEKKMERSNTCAQLGLSVGSRFIYLDFQIEVARYLWLNGQTDEVREIHAMVAREAKAMIDGGLDDLEGHTLAGRADLLLGMLEYQAGLFDESDQHLARALAHFSTTGDRSYLADTLMEQGASYRFRNRLNEAAKAFASADRYHNQALRQQLAQTLRVRYNMAVVSALNGQHFYALKLIESIEPIARQLMKGSLWSGHVLAAKARIVMELGRLEEAKDLYAQTWQIYESIGALNHLATVANNLANLYIEEGDFEQARHYLAQANTYTGKIWGPEQHLRIQQARINYQLRNGNIQAALDEIAVMEPLLADSPDTFRKGRFLSQKGEALILAGEFAQAHDTLAAAIGQHRLSNDNLYLTKSLYLSAQADFDSQQPKDDIIGHLADAVEVIESIRNNMQDDRVRQDYFALQKDVYELSIRAYLQFGQQQQALASLFQAESFRARTLYESLLNNQQPAREDAGELLQRSFDLFGHQLSHTQLPKLSQAELAAYQKTLAAGEAILFFFVGEQQSYAWLVTAGNIELRPLPASAELQQQVTPLIELTHQRPGGGQGNSLWQALFGNDRAVSELILGPFTEQLASITQLTIIPDGVLHRLPFALLFNPNSHYKKPLIQTLSLRYASSIATDRWLKKSNTGNSDGQELLLVANPDVISVEDGTGLAALPAAEQEAQTLLQIWSPFGNSQLLAGAEATKLRFREAEPQQFDVIHFATHATVDWDNPSQSAIKLAANQSDADNPITAADLTLQEIAALKLNAQLVVLSACETAAGKLTTGEGPIGLSRAFFEAGAQRVLASLWPVDDQATAELLQYFYQALMVERLPPAQALQQAQLQLQQQSQFFHPYFWSGFVLVGNEQNWLEKPAAIMATSPAD
ncbi:CHAT domain-containing protein [Halioxenophilus sp. WMMB6]|uniref:CHAT domain-containing protein n=1 Tax=Halioxenophilus sp. WMMB6 TaxID=3073815 RepID=UPI00295E8F58|nr:CHAT domain-containing protein [Halioxenophilus sp. WMMB6]